MAIRPSSVLLTIPHPDQHEPQRRHARVRAGRLSYIGVGDGGSANDPPNNAQNINVLLGKILRIDINPADGAVRIALDESVLRRDSGPRRDLRVPASATRGASASTG